MKVVLILPKWTLACESCCAKLHFECRLSCGGTFKSMQGLCNFSVGWHAWTLTLWLLAWFTVLPKSTNMLRRLTWYSTWHPAQWGGENPCTTYNCSPWHSTCSLLLERGTLIDGVIFLTSFQLECTVMSADGWRSATDSWRKPKGGHPVLSRPTLWNMDLGHICKLCLAKNQTEDSQSHSTTGSPAC